MTSRSRADDPAVMDKLLTSLREGNFREVACAHAGIAQKTLQNWMNWADEAEDGNDAKAKFIDIADRIRLAEAEAEQTSVRLLREASKGWQAHAWWLERAKQTRWGMRRTHAELAADKAAEAAANAANEDIDEAAVEHVLSKPGLRERVIKGA